MTIQLRRNQLTPPHTYSVPVYGKKTQFAKPPDDSLHLDKKGIKYVQGVVGSLLYYGRGTDSAMLATLNELSRQHSKPTLGHM